ncbi:esterase/lipase family protein [Pseudanabaena mucicola]|uniref:Lipase n=1 Tax=Pseudanabaena mucicola FACHB-723 TaxID=2692860 RepID=A0ABR7ZX39_9CYAN|nr:lipase [Pseudanabaena mucicola]MBD2188040.1 lipase [Pseudanabaena mucicola FACHB-723]
MQTVNNSEIPNIILAGYLAGAADYLPIAKILQAQNLSATVVPLKWWDWVPTLGGRSIAPILEKLDQTVNQELARTGASKVNIIAHSAGGWLSRIYLGDQPYYDKVWNARSKVVKLVCLGTPQRSLEPWAVRNLGFVNDHYPHAFYADIEYICIAGKSVQGAKSSPQKWLAYSSYELTTGQGDAWGDGIIPIEAAYLDGATNIAIDGVYHSPRSGKWYGSADAIAIWSQYLI